MEYLAGVKLADGIARQFTKIAAAQVHKRGKKTKEDKKRRGRKRG